MSKPKQITYPIFECTIKFLPEDVVNLFISACEGGSNYWCKAVQPKGPKDVDPDAAMLWGFTLEDAMSGKTHEVTPEMIEHAVQIFPRKYPRQFGRWLAEEADAWTGDVFLQLCVFGDCIYG